MIRRHYFQLKAGLIGPDADPERKVTTEFDMAPHFWDVVDGFQASKNAVNVSIAIAQNLWKIEKRMQARGELSREQEEIQRMCGTLQENQGIFQMGDTSRIFHVWAHVFSMPLEGIQFVPAHEDSDRFRKLIGRPYNLAKTTAEIEQMLAAA
jgi:hypothetical protein